MLHVGVAFTGQQAEMNVTSLMAHDNVLSVTEQYPHMDKPWKEQLRITGCRWMTQRKISMWLGKKFRRNTRDALAYPGSQGAIT